MIFVHKRQKRPSELRFTGVPPPFAISKSSKNIERTLFSWAKSKTLSLSKNVKMDPQKYVLQGSPQNIERTLFLWAKIKKLTLSKNVKIDPQEYVLQGFPLPLLSPKTLEP